MASQSSVRRTERACCRPLLCTLQPALISLPPDWLKPWRIGTTTAINGKPYSVAYTGQAQLISAQGELPKLPPLGQPFGMVELRSADGEVLGVLLVVL